MYTDLPELGVGIGWRGELAAAIAAHASSVDWCEVITEHYIHAPADRLDHLGQLARTFPIVPHGVDLSIGTDGPLDEAYLAALETVLDRVDPPWFSDHLCFTRVPGFNLGQLTPLPFSEETVEIVVRKARQVKARMPRPFLLENIAYPFKVPGGTLSESEFIARVLERADLGLLLDLCNLYVNSMNHGYDPYAFLRSLPLERVVQVHIAGGVRHRGRWIDSHSRPVPPEVFQLLDYVLARAPVKGVLLERDADFPTAFGELVTELNTARSLFKKHHGLRSTRSFALAGG